MLTFGHRKVQGLAVRPGGQIFDVDHGANRDDEVNLLRPGANGGWDPVPGYDERAPTTDLAKFLDANGGGADRVLRVTPG